MRRKDVDDLVLRQERQNHSNAVLATNMAMEKMSIALVKISNDHKKDVTELKNYIRKLELALNKIDNSSCEIYKDQHNAIQALRNENLDVKKKCIHLDCEKQKLFALVQSNLEHIVQENRNGLDFKKELKEKFNYIEHTIEKKAIKAQEELRKSADAILNRPSEYASLKEYVDNKFNETQIDHKGIYTNIGFFKAKYDIVDKKIENIYTLIQRIEKKL